MRKQLVTLLLVFLTIFIYSFLQTTASSADCRGNLTITYKSLNGEILKPSNINVELWGCKETGLFRTCKEEKRMTFNGNPVVFNNINTSNNWQYLIKMNYTINLTNATILVKSHKFKLENLNCKNKIDKTKTLYLESCEHLCLKNTKVLGIKESWIELAQFIYTFMRNQAAGILPITTHAFLGSCESKVTDDPKEVESFLRFLEDVASSYLISATCKISASVAEINRKNGKSVWKLSMDVSHERTEVLRLFAVLNALKGEDGTGTGRQKKGCTCVCANPGKSPEATKKCRDATIIKCAFCCAANCKG